MTKRNLLLVSLLFVVGLVAPSAVAQAVSGDSTTFTISSDTFYLRPNSVADAAGPVYFNFTSGVGTIASTLPASPFILVTYSAPIVGASGVAAAPLGDFCTDGDVLTGAALPNVPICASGDITVKVNPANAKQLEIFVSTPITGITSGTFSISGLRFNTVGLPANSFITATVSVNVQNQVFPLEFVTPTQSVGQIGYNPTYGWGSVAASVPVGGAASLLTCYMGKTTDFTVDVVEQWAGAWTSPTDETILAPYLATGSLGSEVAITLTGVPSGATVAPVSTGTITGLGVGYTWVSSTPTPITLSNGNLVFVYELASTTRDEVEGASFTFSITTTGAITTQLAPVTASVTLTPNTPTSPPPYPAFTYPSTGPNQEEPYYPLTLVTFLGCETNLLFPYVTNYTSGSTALGNWDTGIVVANTSSDPYASEATIYGDPAGATPTAGSCTFYVYASTSGSLTPSSDASPAVTFTRPTVYTGGVDSFLLSSTKAKGLPAGYAIAVCNFLNGVGYALIADNANGLGSWGVMGNYLAYVIPNPFEDPRWYNAEWGEFAITPFPWYNYYGNFPTPNVSKGSATRMRAPSLK